MILVFCRVLIVDHRHTQIYWLIVLVAWGTTKILLTRSSIDIDAKNDQHDAWTFGQILPVLLLIAPIWSLVTAFAFVDRSERLRRLTRTQENSLMAASATQISSHENVAHSTTAGAVDSRSIGETRYISWYWKGPCLAFPCLLIFVVTCLQFVYVSVSSSPLMGFWVDDGMMYVLLLVYPFGLQCSILVGLVHEEGILGDRSAPSRSKAFRALFWLTIIIVWGLFIMAWMFSTSQVGLPPNFRYAGLIGGTVVLHLIYALGYFFQAFRNRSGFS